MRTSVIVPTFNEAPNAAEMLRRLAASLEVTDEVVFVDDGSDDLPDVVLRESVRYAVSIKVIRRANAEGGLGGAVLHGVAHSTGELIVVCDGDLQHPPELIPELVRGAGDADVVVASRYCAGGGSAGLAGRWRKVASTSTGRLSKALFPAKLRRCSDPMSGFFAVRRAALPLERLRPNGFKILLEILLRSDRLRIAEVPYLFGQRLAGESHASLREGLRFLSILLRTRVMNRAVAFMLVGISGVVPNLLTLWLMTRGGTPYLVAAALSTQIAIAWNFIGAELMVWKDSRAGQWERRLVKFALIGETDLLRLPLVFGLVELAGLRPVLATVISMVCAFLFRFTLADKIVYRRIPVAPDPAALTTAVVGDAVVEPAR